MTGELSGELSSPFWVLAGREWDVCVSLGVEVRTSGHLLYVPRWAQYLYATVHREVFEVLVRFVQAEALEEALAGVAAAVVDPDPVLAYVLDGRPEDSLPDTAPRYTRDQIRRLRGVLKVYGYGS